MSKIGISKEALKEMIRDNVKMLYRKALEKATVEEIYQAAAFTVRDIILVIFLNETVISVALGHCTHTAAKFDLYSIFAPLYAPGAQKPSGFEILQ